MIPKAHRYDVAVIGAGLGGSTLAAALARNGVNVLLIDEGVHPRFALGEVSTPYTNAVIRVLAARYNLPELNVLTSVKASTRAIGHTFGVRRHTGFLRHEQGKPQNPRETSQFHTGPAGDGTLLYRQDVDAYAFHLALLHGAVPKQAYRVAGVDFDGSGATVHGADGSEYRARYVVDAGGARSHLAQKFQLREEIPRYKHQSRAVYTHVYGMPRTDALWPDRKGEHVPPVPWHEGAVHHTFHRGAAWAYGFGNNTYSRNPLTSIGVSVDPRVWPKDPELSAQEEFAAVTGLFPDLKRQFEGAVPVREWASTDRLQYSSKQTVGDRWVLLGDSAGYIDPLLSSDVAITLDAVNTLAWRLLRACHDDDFSADRFDHVEQWQQARFSYHDEIANAAYTSFDHFSLWKAVFRVASWGDTYAAHRAEAELGGFRKDGDDRRFQNLEKGRYIGFDWPDHDGFKHLFDTMVQNVDALQAGKITADEASDALWNGLEEADYMPQPLGFGSRGTNFVSPRPASMARTAAWLLRHGDPKVRGTLLRTGRDALVSRITSRVR